MKHKFRLFTNGHHTYMELDGKTIGQGVTSVKFDHSENGDVMLNLQINLKDFEFMKDGYFDEMQKRVAELPDKEQLQ